MKIDKWYENEKICYADCYFYPNSGEYRGNLYNENGKIVGDYTAKDSVEIGKRFPNIIWDF